MVPLSAAGCCAHCANPINLAPGSKQRAPGACLPRHPLKNAPRPPLLSESLPQRQRSCSFPLICCFFASSLVWEEGGGVAFSPAEGGPDGEGGGRWRWGGRNFFWEKLHSRGLRQEQGENYGSTESQSQYKKKIFPAKKGLSGQKRWPIQMLKTPEFSTRQIKTLLDI